MSAPLAKKSRQTMLSFINKEPALEFIEHEEYIIGTHPKCKGCCKIAAFDMDQTLIGVKSGKKFPKDHHDWVLLANAKEKLAKYHEEGYKIVVISNQKGIKRVGIDNFKIKLSAITTALNIPLQFYISIGDGIYRKPRPGIWTILLPKYNDGIKIDVEQCFYVGDAAGRIEKNGRKADFSVSDIMFAKNAGLKFYTPEEIFNGESAPIKTDFKENLVDLTKVPRGLTKEARDIIDFKHEKDCEVVILFGYPASGKSHLTKIFQSKDYRVVSTETPMKCLELMNSYLDEKKSVVVDRTNIDKASRGYFIDSIRKRKDPVFIRCIEMTAPMDLCRHNAKFREITNPNAEHISIVVYYKMRKNYQPVDISEGFDIIMKLPFYIDNDVDEFYFNYLLEN